MALKLIGVGDLSTKQPDLDSAGMAMIADLLTSANWLIGLGFDRQIINKFWFDVLSDSPGRDQHK
jgi:hypothetical protein